MNKGPNHKITVERHAKDVKQGIYKQTRIQSRGNSYSFGLFLQLSVFGSLVCHSFSKSRQQCLAVLKHCAILTAIIATFLTWTAPVSDAELALGSYTFATVPACSLVGSHLSRSLAKPSLASSLSSYGFLNAVGGVAFAGVAIPRPGCTVVALHYRSEEQDGRRLEVELSSKGKRQTVVASVYDWQLKPIAEFADTDEIACFTLFGKLKDEENTRERVSRGQEILNYHPAFENTLLGLRLMQADILILRPDSCDLVKRDGSWLLGADETEPDIEKNQQRLARTDRVIERLSGGPFQSYVICDQEITVTFSPSNGALSLTGNPVWFCWKTKQNDAETLAKVQREANRRGNERLRALPDVQSMDSVERQKYFEGFFDEYISSVLLQQMPAYSRKLSASIQHEDGINPAIYSALCTTMRYAAFFRYVKKHQPQEWDQFIKSINALQPAPNVETPTVMIPPPGSRAER